MIDYVLLLLLVTHFSYYELLLKPIDTELGGMQEVASLLWVEGALVGDKLNECKKQIRRKR